MTHMQFEHLMQQIAETQDEEISCSNCFAAIDQYVQSELTGAPAAEQWLAMQQHLRQCRVCHEEYEILRDLVRQEEQGSLPSGAQP